MKKEFFIKKVGLWKKNKKNGKALMIKELPLQKSLNLMRRMIRLGLTP